MKPSCANAIMSDRVAGFLRHRTLRVDGASEQTITGCGVAIREPTTTELVRSAVPRIDAASQLAYVAARARRAAIPAEARIDLCVDTLEQATLEAGRADAFVSLHVASFVIFLALRVSDATSQAVARLLVAVREPAAPQSVRSAIRWIDADASLAYVLSRTHRGAIPAMAVGSRNLHR